MLLFRLLVVVVVLVIGENGSFLEVVKAFAVYIFGKISVSEWRTFSRGISSANTSRCAHFSPFPAYFFGQVDDTTQVLQKQDRALFIFFSFPSLPFFFDLLW